MGRVLGQEVPDDYQWGGGYGTAPGPNGQEMPMQPNHPDWADFMATQNSHGRDGQGEMLPQALTNSLTGQLGGINNERFGNQLDPMQMQQFMQMMKQQQTGPNMQGYDQLRQTLGAGGTPQPPQPPPQMAMNATPLRRPNPGQ